MSTWLGLSATLQAQSSELIPSLPSKTAEVCSNNDLEERESFISGGRERAEPQ